MINKRIAYINEYGTLSIIIPSAECSCIEELLKSVPDGLNFKILDSSDIPDDRTFRNAWELSDD